MTLVSGLSDKRYRLLEKLERGRANPIWLADKLWFDGSPVRVVALKTMGAGDGDELGMKRRAALFHREMCVAAALWHPNIVRVDAWGFDDLFGSTFFEMQRVKGLDLLELLTRRGVTGAERRGALPPQDVAWIGMRAAAALHYAHHYRQLSRAEARAEARHAGRTKLTLEDQSGVAHGDLCPKSIMVDVEGEVKLVGWSASVPLDAAGDALPQTVTHPESTRGPLDASDDVHRLGVALAFALAPQAPPALQALLESMTHVDRERRPRAAELLEPFEDLVTQLGGGSQVAVQRQLGVRVQEHYREPRRPPRLRLLRGGAS